MTEVRRELSFIFSWEKIHEDDKESDKGKLIEFLKQNFCLDWIEEAKIEKIDNDTTIKAYAEYNSLSIKLNDEKTKATLAIDDGRTDVFVAKKENDNLKIYKKYKQCGPGRHPVGRWIVVLMMVYLIFVSLILLLSFVRFWPPPTFIGEHAVILEEQEIRLLIIVALAGALGGLVHTLRSFYWYVGNRNLVWSWLSMYFLLPFVGATLGIVFYLIIRGVFFSSQATATQTNPFGFVALSALVGLFSEEAVLKLKDVAERLLTIAPPGTNSIPQNSKTEIGTKTQR